ncbi:MAG: acetate/propionate family kinase [Candidatus Melainabacteria bacterium]|nr:acetate/propionate family kinase [Candidatus Melainabacteria bacterium]MBX9672728.1 acetate/propionate family kinase [Candidatus Obscuribacterales bacterium]
MPKILVINAGSMTQKFALYHADASRDEAIDKLQLSSDNKQYKEALFDFLQDPADIVAVGHRIVHGGADFTQPKILGKDDIEILEKMIALAPLHNPPAIKFVKESLDQFPQAKQILVFDTGFHSTLDPVHYLYPLPQKIEQLGIRKFGFHGISHKYCLQETSRQLGKNTQDVSMISCHLGGGASVCAMTGGKSVDTSMGYTPMDGLMMASRPGSIDFGIVLNLLTTHEMTLEDLNQSLVKQSGLLGVSRLSADMLTVKKAAQEGNERARLAIDMYALSVAKGIGAMTASLPRLDAISFTGGIGYNDKDLQNAVMARLPYLQALHTKVFSIKSEEEYMVSRECLGFL